MSHRYAVLWEPGSDRARPVGLAVEQDGFVLVEVRSDLAMPARYEEPFLVRGPDMTVIQYTPEDAQYFDQVLLDLSRSLIIRNEGSVSEATEGVVLDLLRRQVLDPLRRDRQVVYCDPNTAWPAVTRYRRRYYEESDTAERQAYPTSVGSSAGRRLAGLVAA